MSTPTDGRCPRCHPSDEHLTWYRDSFFYARTLGGYRTLTFKTAEEREATCPRSGWWWIEPSDVPIDDLHHHNHGECCEHSYAKGCDYVRRT